MFCADAPIYFADLPEELLHPPINTNLPFSTKFSHFAVDSAFVIEKEEQLPAQVDFTKHSPVLVIKI